ncbi:MAG TPA: AI-2E family transporter, partial [Flavobacteriales bacterium]|nr:AI-2E family transporter [Flavobacteriales bacterium]
MTDRPFTLDRLVRSVGTLLVLAALLWLLWYLRAVLVPFFIALLLAYLLEPLVRLVRRRVKNHTVAVLITLTGIFLLTVSLLLVIIPQITAETRHFARLMTEQMPAWQAEAEHLPWVRRMLEQLSSVDVQSYLTGESLARLAQKVLPGFWQGINNVFGWLLGLAGAITTLIYLVFMLIDQEDVSAHWRNMVPEKYRDLVAGLATDLGEAMEVHFRGQMKIALILSVIYTIGFWLVGLPLSVVLGLL